MNASRKESLEKLRLERAGWLDELGKRDPVYLARRLGIELDPWQRDFLRSDSKRIILNCSRQAGKSTTSALKALHTALYKPGSLVLVLGPAERQAKEFFGKVSGFYRQLGHKVAPSSERKLGMELENGSRIEALPGTEKTVRGFSAVSLLMLDEASRVDPNLYYAVRPMLAVSGGALVMLSTPYGKTGVFYEEWAHGVGWEHFKVTAEDVPRISNSFLAEERATMPDLEFRREYFCEFTETEDSLMALSWLEAAGHRPPVPTTGVLWAGLDVAGPGEDETVLVIRDADSVVDMRSWNGVDPRGAVVNALRPYKLRLQTVNVDSVGIGYYMAQHLRDAGFPVREVNAGERSARPERYANVKAEGYWGLRMRAEAGEIRGLTDETAASQLAGLRYEHNARGQVVIESKEQARKRGVKSPDRAEALMLAFYERPYVEVPEGLVESFDAFERERPKRKDEEAGYDVFGGLVANDSDAG